MTSKEILWTSHRFAEEKVFEDDTSFGKYSTMVIGDDLRRAIIALRSVPTLNWSLTSLNEVPPPQCQVLGDSDRTETAEYVWKTEALDWPYSGRLSSDWNCEFSRSFIGKTGATTISDVAKDTEVMESDVTGAKSLTFTRGKIDQVPDISPKMTATGVELGHNSLSGLTNNRASQTHQSLSPPRCSAGVSKTVSPVPPKPHFRSQGSDHRAGASSESSNKKQETSTAVQELFDIYERSLDILESEDLTKKTELTSPRSNSPETLLEELLDSISNYEYDTLTSKHQKTSVLVSKAKETTFTKLQTLNNKSSSFDAKNGVTKTNDVNPTDSEMKTFILTGVLKSDSELKTDTNSGREQNNNYILFGERPTDHQTSCFAKNQSRTLFSSASFPEGTSNVPSNLFNPQTSERNRISKPVVNDIEPTPEDIFEEIMDSLETAKSESVGKHTAGTSNKIVPQPRAKYVAENALDKPSSADHSPENGWMGVYYNRTQAGVQVCLRDMVSKKTEFTAKNQPHCDSNATNSLANKVKHSEEGKSSSTSTNCFSLSTNDPTNCLSENNSASRISQETVYCTVKQRPAPPLREKTPKVSFAQTDSLIYRFRQIPSVPLVSRHPAPIPERRQVSSPGDTNKATIPAHSSESGSVNRTVISSSVHGLQFNESRRQTQGLSEDNDGDITQSLLSLNRKQIEASSKEVRSPQQRFLEENLCDFDSEMDLDSLEAEFQRNLEACTVSDIECSGIDKLMTSETQSSSLTARRNGSTTERMKYSKKLGTLLAKRRLQRAPHAVDCYDDAASPTSTTTGTTTNTTTNTPITTVTITIESSKLANASHLHQLQQPSSDHISAWKMPEKALTPDDAGLYPQGFHALRSPVPSDGRFAVPSSRDTNRTLCSSNKNLTNGEVGRNIEKRSPGSDEIEVLSEEVTSQELLLKIVWPKGEVVSPSQTSKKTGRPPFRELQLQRMLRICDDPDDSPRGISETSLANLHDLNHPEQLDPHRTNKDLTITKVVNPNRSIVTFNGTEYEIKDKRREYSHKMVQDSDSKVDVHQERSVTVLRGPGADDRPLPPSIKRIVSEVGTKIADDFERSPTKRSVRVSCEATESRSNSTFRDREDITVIHNTILDTLRPVPNGNHILAKRF